MQQQDKEIFQSYEIKNWNFNPRIYKILGVATVFNLLVVFVMAQADIFTTRGCDSPMVSRVCQVLDTIYVGSVLLTSDKGYVDKPYDIDEFKEADITYIDVSNQAPPLTYPAGYFALANPESQFSNVTTTDGFQTTTSGIPGIPGFSNPTLMNQPNPTTNLADIPQVTPTPNKNSITGPVPTLPFDLGGIKPSKNPVPDPPKNTTRGVLPNLNARKPKLRNDSPKTLPDISDDTVAETKKPDNTNSQNTEEPKNEPITEVEINKRPIKDLGVYVNTLLKDDKAKFNLETQFEAKAKGKLTKEGKLDKNTVIETNSADPNMKEVVKQSIEAINAAGYLQYLKMLSGKDLNLLLKQDDAGITAVVQSEMENKQRANTMRDILNLGIKLSKDKKNSPNADQQDKDDLELLNGATVETDGKNLIIKFSVRKEIALEMIKRKLLEEATKPQSNNTAQGTNLTQTLTK